MATTATATEPETITLSGIPGLPGETEAVEIGSRTAAIRWLREGRVVAASGSEGALTVWAAGGVYRCEFHRFLVTQDSCEWLHLAAVDEWLRLWFPRLNGREDAAGLVVEVDERRNTARQSAVVDYGVEPTSMLPAADALDELGFGEIAAFLRDLSFDPQE